MKRIFLALSAIAMLGFISCKENAASKINTEECGRGCRTGPRG